MCSRSALRLERQVQIFEAGLAVCGSNRRRQLWRQDSLLLDALQDGRTTVLEFPEIGKPLGERAQLRVVEPSCRLLPVTGNEWYGGVIVQQRDRGRHLLDTDAELLSNA